MNLPSDKRDSADRSRLHRAALEGVAAATLAAVFPAVDVGISEAPLPHPTIIAMSTTIRVMA